MNWNCVRIVRLLSVLIVAGAPPALIAGGIEPSFYLDDVSFRATSIVVVMATKQDGVFEVSESWRGDLRRGEIITLPGLIPGRDAVSRLSVLRWEDFLSKDEDDPSVQIPKQDVGARMVLFLKQEAPARDGNSKVTAWSSASLDGGFKTSVAWIDGDQVFAFQQFGNPGRSVLAPLNFGEFSESKMKERVAEIVRVRQDLEQIAQLEDGAERAKRLKSFVHSDIVTVRPAVVEELGKTGLAGASVIREMLNDDSYPAEASELVKSYATADGETAAQGLNELLHNEVQFWRARGPSLPEGWWNQTELPYREAVQGQYMKTTELIRALQKTSYIEAASTARELRDFWESLPQLDEHNGRSQMVEECDRLIDHLSQ